MPEQLFDPSFRYYDSSGCKCTKIIHLYKEISKVDVAKDDSDNLKKTYNDIYDMYADIISSTEAALYIKDEQVSVIRRNVAQKATSDISNLDECINEFEDSLYEKEIEVDTLERIDDRYHRGD